LSLLEVFNVVVNYIMIISIFCTLWYDLLRWGVTKLYFMILLLTSVY